MVTALIAGAGLAGTATAIALDRAGIDAALCEVSPTAADDIGAWLTLASNGVDALTTLGVAEALDGVRGRGHAGAVPAGPPVSERGLHGLRAAAPVAGRSGGHAGQALR
jgi:2-polyprenyl-6-methoxyphenol hydroxylase-like FAD-dependent oxidoreductase